MTRSLSAGCTMFRRRRHCGAFALWFLGSFLPWVNPASMAGRQPQTSTIRVQTNLVEVPVTVSDKKGRAVTGLTSKDFRIYEDGIEQPVQHFTREPGPVSWGLILDRSGSMALMMKEVYTAAIHMLDASPPRSEAFIMTFNKDLELVQEFTSDRARLRASIEGLLPGGSTALWDAVFEGLEEMKKAGTNRKALVVVTDGEDNASQTDPRDLIEKVKESDVLVYSVAMLESDPRPYWLFGNGTHSKLFDLAEASGAYAHRPHSVEQCKEVMQRIASEVSHQYILGYYPLDTSGPPRFRKLKVQVQRSRGSDGLVVRARRGYLGPRDQVGSNAPVVMNPRHVKGLSYAQADSTHRR